MDEVGPVTQEMKEFLRKRRLAYVATVSPDGSPNLSPKGTVLAIDSRSLVFADIRSPRTVSNLAANPAVEINSVDPVSRRGYRFAGRARLLGRGEPELEKAAAMYAQMGVRSEVRGVVLVSVERASEVTSPVYDLGDTEEQVRKAWSGRI